MRDTLIGLLTVAVVLALAVVPVVAVSLLVGDDTPAAPTAPTQAQRRVVSRVGKPELRKRRRQRRRGRRR